MSKKDFEHYVELFSERTGRSKEEVMDLAIIKEIEKEVIEK